MEMQHFKPINNGRDDSEYMTIVCVQAGDRWLRIFALAAKR